MSMINKTRLEEFGNGLWAKIKQEVGDGIVNISFDDNTSILTATKGDGTSIEINLISLVEDWRDLSHVTEISVPNLFSSGRMIPGYWYEANGNLQANSAWSYYISDFEISAGQTYRRIADLNTNSTVCAFLNANNELVEVGNWTKIADIQGKHAYELTIPNTSNIKKFTINLQHKINQQNGLYLWDGVHNPTDVYVPYSDGASILIDGTNVSTKFDPKDSALKSTTLASAIREVNGKFKTIYNNFVINSSERIADANAFKTNGYAKTLDSTVNLPAAANNRWGIIQFVKESENTGVQIWYPVDGNQRGIIWTRSLLKGNWTNWSSAYDKFVLQTDVGNEANKIPRLGADGKLVSSILPKIAINETILFTKPTEQQGQQAAMDAAMENGDMLILRIGTAEPYKIKKYLCFDTTASSFVNRFIELTFPTDGVTETELQTALSNYVRQDETGTGANQVLRLDAQGKIDDNNLKIATSEEINAIINALN